MAHKKGVGSSRNGRDSNPQNLGVKLYGGQKCKAGAIIVRQRGTKFSPGAGVGIGSDDTLYALREGYIHFEGHQKGRRKVSVTDVNPNAAARERMAQEAAAAA